MTSDASTQTSSASAREVAALVEASKVISAAVAHSLAVAEEQRISLPALRILVMLDTEGSMNLTSVADRLGVKASTASRTCDRLVRAGLVDRRGDENDRRHVSLSLTADGARFVADVMAERRDILVRILESMGQRGRAQLIAGLEAFVAAADQLPGRGERDDAGGRAMRRAI